MTGETLWKIVLALVIVPVLAYASVAMWAVFIQIVLRLEKACPQ